MADAVIEMEARLRDYITEKLDTIDTNLKRVDTQAKKTFSDTTFKGVIRAELVMELLRKATQLTMVTMRGFAQTMGNENVKEFKEFQTAIDNVQYSFYQALLPSVRDFLSWMNENFVPGVQYYSQLLDGLLNPRKAAHKNAVQGLVDRYIEDLSRLKQELAKMESDFSQGPMSVLGGAVSTHDIAVKKEEIKIVLDMLKSAQKELNELSKPPTRPRQPPKATATKPEGLPYTVEDLTSYYKEFYNVQREWAMRALELVQDKYVRERAIVDQEEKNKIADLDEYRRTNFMLDSDYLNRRNIIVREAEQARTLIEKEQSEERLKQMELEQKLREQTGDALVNATRAVMQAVVDINSEKKEEMKPILYAMAVMEAASSTVKAVSAAWETAGGNYYLGAVLSVAAVVENAALLASQISAISSAATGADYVARRPQPLMVGDNATMNERVTVTPLGSANSQAPARGGNGPSGGTAVYNVTVYANSKDDVLQAMRELERDGATWRSRRVG